MPQLEKGGKYVFGWSLVGEDGSILLPPEAAREYKLSVGMKVILISGSKTSGGFAIVDRSSLEQTVLGNVLKEIPDLRDYQTDEGKVVHHKQKNYCWVTLRKNNTIVPGRPALDAYRIRPGDRLLSVRGSGVGPAMIVKGPLVENARTHPEIKSF